MQTEGQPAPRTRSAFREIVETALITLLVYLVVRTFLCENYRVVGSSMEPTLQDGQYLVVNKLGYRLHAPQRGDIVVFRDVNTEGRKLIKRVIGLPGETVEIRTGEVFIDGQPVQEPYLDAPVRYSLAPTVVPDGQYFVLGDNRNNSSDSHSWGTLPREEMVGKAWLCYWPPSLWGVIQHEAYADLSG